MSRARGWWDDPVIFHARLEEAGDCASLSRKTGVPASTLKSARQRHERDGVWPGSEPVADTSSDVEFTASADDKRSIDDMMLERGMSPDDWFVRDVVVNQWTQADGSLARQLKAFLRRKASLELVAPACDIKPLPAPKPPDKSKPRLVVFVGDEQEPWGDPALKELFLRWLAHNRPDEGVHLGDLIDLGSLSRHRSNPIWDATVQDGVNAAFLNLKHRREASPETAWVALPCNHGERLRDYQLARAADLYGVRPADIDEERFHPALSIPGLLHFDKLGIKYLGGDGDYEHVQHDLTDNLVARHGWITGSNSAEKTVRKLGLNVVVGHTHRQRMTPITEERRRERFTLTAVEAGCMCRIEGGLGYVVNPDWQNGWATAVIHPDGTHNLELATYSDGVVRWRDQRYSATDRIRRAA